MDMISLNRLEVNRPNRIGYTCPHIPVEIISATGLKPYCLLHGDLELMDRGTDYMRIDACPLVRSNIAHILQESDRYAALVGSIGCDMSRRLFDVIGEHTNIPTYVLHMPRTDNFQIFSDEIDWLVERLEHQFNMSIKEKCISEINKWETLRSGFRAMERKRYIGTPLLTTSVFHAAASTYYQGTPLVTAIQPQTNSNGPRVYIVGSECSYESTDFLRLLEENLSIVGDNVCGLSQFLNVRIKNKSLHGIKETYYTQIPCIYRHPHTAYYDYVLSQLKERSCDGVIGFTLDYCDHYEFELKKMEEIFGLPLLRIRTDYAREKVGQLKTRIAAFGEMLC
jgi:benzoyl-CoA reductase/2-hydroxyglutaryl-CoA dehydratase subunit BcrC/BadD/HgdB